LLGTSQTKEVDTMARASVATAQPPDHVLRTDPSRYKKNW